MKKFLLIAMVAVFVLANNAEAQQRRGRFFQKIKEDLFGAKQSEEKSEKRQSPDKSPSDDRKSASERNAFRNPAQQQVPTLARSSSTSSNFKQRNPGSQNGFAPKSQYSQPSQQKVRAKSASSGAKGFGFSVVLGKDDQLVVSAVDRYGNAAKEGLRRGDLILEIGGIEASSVEEFEEIVKIMNSGDQMEFKIKRSGRPQKLDIMFGEMPEAKELESKSAISERPRYDFAPPTTTRRSSQSVLNGSSNNPVRQNFSDQPGSNRQIRKLTQTIENQNRQIRMLQEQILQLRQQRRSR